MRLIVSVFLLALFVSNALSASSSDRGTWGVKWPSSADHLCMKMMAQLDFTLTYIKTNEDTADVKVTLPGSSPVNGPGSQCQTVLNFTGIDNVNAQVMQIDFDHHEGWNVRLVFTNDSRFQTNDGSEWTLLQVDVTANYSSWSDLFPDARDENHTYYQPIDPAETPEIADMYYTQRGRPFYCPSAQKFAINKDTANGPLAYVQFSLVKMEAYMDATDFDDNQDTCPTDQHVTDKVPLIVGGVLAGLTLLTLVVYLVYRCRLPPEVVHLTAHENHAMIDDDERTKSVATVSSDGF